MFAFSLPKNVGLSVAALLFVAAVACYGADYQIYGYENTLVPVLSALTFAFSVIHYRKGPGNRRTQDAETLGWQMLFLIIAALYLARDVWALSESTVQNVFSVAIVLQIFNYVRCKTRARAKSG